MKNKWLLLLFLAFVVSTQVKAASVVSSTFSGYSNPPQSPASSVGTTSVIKLLISSYSSSSSFVSDSVLLHNLEVLQKSATPLSGKLLIYPNPVKLSSQSVEFQYNLSAPMDIDMLIYDWMGNRVFSAHYPAGANGGTTFNDINLSASDFSGTLSASVYFVVLMNNKQLVGKAKMAVRP